MTIASGMQRSRGVSKASLVQDGLRRAIIQLHLPPGSRLDKAVICAEFSVSRQPVSDALARLAEERLVEVEPQKGTFVARIRLSDVMEAAFVRQALEAATVRAIAASLDQPTLLNLERSLAYQEAALASDDAEGFYEFDQQFHRVLYDRLAFGQVVDMIDLSRGQLERARRMLLPKSGRMEATLSEHRRIFEALATRDPDTSATAMRLHMQAVSAEIQKFAHARPNLFEPE